MVGEDAAVEARDRDVDAGGAEIGHEHMAGVRPERQLTRRPAACAGSDIAFEEEPPVDQLPDPLGHDRPPEPRPRYQL